MLEKSIPAGCPKAMWFIFSPTLDSMVCLIIINPGNNRWLQGISLQPKWGILHQPFYSSYIYISWMKWYEKYWNDQLRIQNHGHEFRITKTHSQPWWFTVVAVIHRNPDQEGSGAATNAAHRFPAFRKKKHSPFWNHRFLNECRVTIANAHPWWPRFIRQKNL